MKMSPEERKKYDRYLEKLRDQASYVYNRRIEGEEKVEEEKKQAKESRKERKRYRSSS